MFYLVSVAEETGLSLTLSDAPKTGFCRDKAHMLYLSCGMRFSTMWYVRPAKPQNSLGIRAV